MFSREIFISGKQFRPDRNTTDARPSASRGDGSSVSKPSFLNASTIPWRTAGRLTQNASIRSRKSSGSGGSLKAVSTAQLVFAASHHCHPLRYCRTDRGVGRFPVTESDRSVASDRALFVDCHFGWPWEPSTEPTHRTRLPGSMVNVFLLPLGKQTLSSVHGGRPAEDRSARAPVREELRSPTGPQCLTPENDLGFHRSTSKLFERGTVQLRKPSVTARLGSAP